MTSFTIDDVRETMPPEVTGFLNEIEGAGSELLAQPQMSPKDNWQAARTLVRKIATRGHAITGTSLLVSANALASCARLIEELATRADTEMREARERAARARRAIELVPAGVERMREILQLELDHQDEEAQWTAAEWQSTAEALLSALSEAHGVVASPSMGPTLSLVPPPDQVEELPTPALPAPPDAPPAAAVDAAIPKAEPATKVPESPDHGADNVLELDFGEYPAEQVTELSFDDIVEEPSTAAGHRAPPVPAKVATPPQRGESETAGSTTASGVGAPLPPAAADPDDEFAFAEPEESSSAATSSPTAQTASPASAPPANAPPEEFAFAEPEPSEGQAAGSTEGADRQEFAFGDEGDGLATAAAASGNLVDELKGVFQQEAREAVVVLQGYLASVAADLTNRSLILPLERVYHTLKGAAATVGLTDVSARAANLQHRSEEAAVHGIDRAALDALVRDTNEMLSVAGLDSIALTPPPALAAPPPGATASKLSAAEQAIWKAFVTEASTLHQQASDLVTALSRTQDDAEASSIVSKLGALFHRLRGSALVAVEDDLAAIAGELERACANAAKPTTAELSVGLARIATKLGANWAKPISHPPDETNTVAATRAAFEVEARQIVDEALKHVQSPSGSADESRQEVPQEVAPLLHRLKGSARVVGDEALAEEARVLEDMIAKPQSEHGPALRVLGERLLELRARLEGPSSILAGGEAAALMTRREKVEITAPDELWDTFMLELGELLDNIERTALALEGSSSPKEQLRTLMRLVHTLKGVVNTTGIAPTGRMLHRVEDFLEKLLGAAPILPPMRGIAAVLLEIHVQVRRNVKEARSGWVETAPEQLERKLAAALSARHDKAPQTSRRGQDSNANTGAGLSTDASERSDVSGSAKSDGSDAHALDRRVIRVSTERLDALMNLAGELVVNRSRLNSRVERLRSLQSELTRGSRTLVETVDAFREDYEFANLNGKRTLALTGTDNTPVETVITPAAPLWTNFGELELDRYEGIHIFARRLAELTSDFSEIHTQLSRGLAALTDDSDVVGGIVSGIQTEVTKARMVPLEMLFLRLRLPLRDAASRERKEVRDVVRGEEVPVDKTIADALFQPMLHLVRNAVVHGIESPERRQQLGKDPVGLIELSARHESGQIVIEVRDDGAGLDLPALHARGIAMGMLPQDTRLDDARVKDMVFVAGLSTRATVGDVAGRGVGGDVLKRTVDRLHGTIRVETTAGVGTTFSIRLPLTLAITRALIVRQGEQSFAVPLHFAERIIDVLDQEVVTTGKLRRVKTQGMLLPIRNLAEFLGQDGAPTKGPVLMLRVGEKRMALQVDSIVAHEDIVVKSLGHILSGHPIFAGINIRGTGDLVLILDVPTLIEGKGDTVHEASVAEPAQTPSTSNEATRPATDKARPAKQSPAAASRPARVMFVDDSLSVRKVAEMQLRELGAEVVVAVDGVDALAKLREQEFDMVFTDLEMPRMHGYELIRELRFLPAFKDLPIVVVSSRSGQKHQDQARQLGANEYLTKPFTVQMLGAALTKWRAGISAAGTDATPSKERTP